MRVHAHEITTFTPVLQLCRHKFSRLLWLLMALNIFNLSADSIDTNPYAPEDLSVNDMESLTEVLAEGLLGFENTFAETDEQDQPGGQSMDFKKVSFCAVQYRLNMLVAQAPLLFAYNPGYISPFAPERYSEVLNPPPEA